MGWRFGTFAAIRVHEANRKLAIVQQSNAPSTHQDELGQRPQPEERGIACHHREAHGVAGRGAAMGLMLCGLRSRCPQVGAPTETLLARLRNAFVIFKKTVHLHSSKCIKHL